MKTEQIKAMVAELAPVIREFVADAQAPLLKRIDELERLQPVIGEKGTDGRDGIDGKDGRDGADGVPGEKGADGKDADPVSDEQIAAAVARYLEINPPAAGKDGRDGVDGSPGRDGNDGKDGRDGTDGANGEKGADGRDGIDGAPGRDGSDGKDGRDGTDGATGEKGADGRDGKDGEVGTKGADGKPGEKGIDGRDGVGLAGAVIDRSGDLVVTLTNGEHKNLGPVLGKDGADGRDGTAGMNGADGRDGADGLGFDELDLIEGERGLSLRLSRGAVVKDYLLPVVIDRGVWRPQEYAKGNGVTWGGSFWIAQRDTSDKPETSDAWRLAVKRGQNGKDGKVA